MEEPELTAVDAAIEEFRRRLRARVRRALRESPGQSVGSPAFHLVETLITRGPLSPADLAALLEVRTSTTAAHLDRLGELGWVRREPAGAARVRVSVTPAGRQAFEHYVAIRRGVLAQMLRPLVPAQVRALAEALRACVEDPAPGGGER